ncbi:MAG: hypothetical protein IH892_08955, partial [Planctomycetes bacterium]|nr:hypothetical protein [Planctomycetota bacterium]
MNSTRTASPNQMSRRAFTTGLATGLASSLLVTSPGLADESRPVGVKRFLYVTNDPERRVDIFDIAVGHSLVRSFPMAGNKVGGACADAASSRLFISQQTEDTVTAYDLRTADVLWHVNTMQEYELNHPDRISITVDGGALYVPMKSSDQTLILDTANGKRLTQFKRPGRPHNSWSGEMGRYMYVAGRSDHTLYMADQRTHEVVKKLGPFSWPVRPFSVDRQERYLYANLTYVVGFGVGDIETGKMAEVHRLPPLERTRHWDKAKLGLPHGDHPFSHGIAVRPEAQEVWYLDDQWGYLNVFDTSKSPMKPTFKGQVELFDKIDEPWQVPREKDVGNCWVAFSLDGKYCYPSDGSVIDAEAGKKTSMRISPSEKLIEVEFRNGVAKRVSGQMGGV